MVSVGTKARLLCSTSLTPTSLSNVNLQVPLLNPFFAQWAKLLKVQQEGRGQRTDEDDNKQQETQQSTRSRKRKHARKPKLPDEVTSSPVSGMFIRKEAQEVREGALLL